MASGIFGLGLTGLAAAQAGLQTTGHNISNVNTPYYSRQQLAQQAGPAQYTGSGFIGTGVNVESIRRVYADHLQSQTQAAAAQTAHYAAYATEVERLGNLLAEPETSLSAAMDGFFSAVQQLAAHPSDPATRQALLFNARSVASRFNAVDASFTEASQRIDGRLRASVDNLNAYAQRIAELNDAIVRAQASGQPPNDLLDQRERVLADINTEVRAATVMESDGRMNVFLPNGQALVVGSTAQTLVVVNDALDPSLLKIGVRAGSGTRAFNDRDLEGGALGGVLAFRDELLLPARNSLGRLALAFGAAVNEQHALGQDRNGLPGGDVFALAEPRASSSTRNTSSAALDAVVADYSALSASDYKVQYDGSNYVITRLADDTQATYAALPQTLDGLIISLASGVPAAGDSFLIQPTRSGAADLAVVLANANQIAAAAPIRTASASTNLGDASISAGQVVSANANLTQAVTITFTDADSFDVSGVGTGNPSGLAYTAGEDISFNGWTVSIAGTPRAGDRFTIGSNTAGAGDNRNALRLGELVQAALVEGNSLSGAYAQIVGFVGSKAQEIEAAKDAHQNLLDRSREALSSVSGVNLDEEAANLLRYQQAYQAAGKLIAIASHLFDSILAIDR